MIHSCSEFQIGLKWLISVNVLGEISETWIYSLCRKKPTKSGGKERQKLNNCRLSSKRPSKQLKLQDPWTSKDSTPSNQVIVFFGKA